MDKLESMQVFIEVTKHMSFVRAGEHLGLSAPAVTRSIAALEAHLQAKLFVRTTRHVRLTEIGHRFLEDARQIVEAVEDAEANAAGVYSAPKGVLTITAPVLFGQRHVTPIITEYLEMHSEVSIRAMFYDRVTSLLEEEMDVAIRIGHLKNSNLYATQVGEVRRVVCGSPAYFKKHGKPQIPSDLKNHRNVFSASPDSSSNWHFSNRGKKEIVKLTPQLRCNHNATALNAAISGFGLTRLMSYQIGEELEKGLVESVLTEFEEPPLPVNVIHLEGRRANAKVRSFIDLAKERLRDNPFVKKVAPHTE